MNKAITDGIDLMPPPFADGLDDWSKEDGTPGTVTYSADPGGNLVAGDPDFGICLEIQKSDPVQRLRYMGEVPILPGCYVQVSARVKVISGPLPAVRIGAFAGGTGGQAITGVVTEGTPVQLDAYGQIYEVQAMIGSGARGGVDLVWGNDAVYGHVGIDITGDNGAVVRVESIRVEDQTVAFHRQLMDWVDVRDYGAMGDGITDDADAFEAADAAADGRDILVPDGTFLLGRNITLLNRTRFDGTLQMSPEHQLILRADFNYNTYIDAFGNETTALQKALQALFHFSDHESLDLMGRRIQLDAPLDVFEAVNDITNFGNRRAIRNGQFAANPTAAWDPDIVNATATYDRDTDQRKLVNVTNIAAIAVGSLVEGFGVGREIYVTAKDEAAGELIISQPLVLAPTSQTYTFTRFKYMLDFSGFNRVNRFQIEDIEFLGNRIGAGIMLPPDGIAWSIRDCWFARPGHRAITSIGSGCNGISIDGNQFLAFDDDERVQDRTSVAINTNKNDIKIRNNRAVQFRHFAVMAGGGHIVSGNHFWQNDDEPMGERSAGIVFCSQNPKTVMVGNYIDNATLDLTNEYDPYPEPYAGKAPFGALSITGNIFTVSEVPDWFTFIRLVPIGSGHPIDGISVTGNTFKPISGAIIDRVDSVDTSRGSFDHSLTRDVTFQANTYRDVTHRTESPALVEIDQTSAQSSWTVSLEDKLPFAGRAIGAEGLTALGTIQTAGGSARWAMPVVDLEQGINQNQIAIRWQEAVRGRVQLRVRTDLPT